MVAISLFFSLNNSYFSTISTMVSCHISSSLIYSIAFLKLSIPARQFKPTFSKPNERPPAPQNKSIKLNLYML